MELKKEFHLKDDALLKSDRKKRSEIVFEDGGRIVSYQPYNGIQIIFFDIHSPEIPDLWKLGFRKGGKERYIRDLFCERGSAECVINGKKDTLIPGQVIMDYKAEDDFKFNFTSGDFRGVEVTTQVNTIIKESIIFKLLRLVLESMPLPVEDIFNSDGYKVSYSKTTGQTLSRLTDSGLQDVDGVMIIALAIELGHNLGTDLRIKQSGKKTKAKEKQLTIAEDIYRCLTEDYGTKYTAAMFAEKYDVSDTTAKNYFKRIYGYGFKEYQTKIRMEKAAELILNTKQKISDIAFSVGYPNQTKFTKAFKNYYNVTPLKYRQGANNQESQ